MKVRLKAFAYHLCISAVVVAIALTLIFVFWYRPPFSYVQNVYGVVITLLSVDLVVGPLLTFAVYNPAKKKLKTDLTLIGIMQVAALAYGLIVCYQSRPIYSVYNDGMFSTVMKGDYLAKELASTPESNPYLDYPVLGTVWVGAAKPAKLSKQDELFIEYSSPFGGGLRLIPRFYVPYEQVAAEAAKSGKLASDLVYKAGIQPPAVAEGKVKPEATTATQVDAVRNFAGSFGLPLDKVVLLPLIGPDKTGIVALEAGTGKRLGAIGESPWW
jgi:hypothetical protein